MKKAFKSGILILGLVWIYLFSLPKPAAAEFSLSYGLTEGGYQLELSPTNQYKGVRIEVGSDVSTRYEVIARMIKPLENKDNPAIIIRDNFVLRGLSGTNRFGNFRVPAEDTAVKSDEILYISDTVGDPDTFTLIYGIIQTQDIAPGNYSGRVSFTLNPIGSSLSPVTKILEIYVSVRQEDGLRPTVEITTASGTKNITLNSRKEEKQNAEVLVKINGKFQKPFSLTQFLVNPLESREGNRLDYAAMNFVVRQAQKGVAVNQITPLSANMQNIYASAPTGEADTNFLITYSLGDLTGQKAGQYHSKIQYLFDDGQAQTKLEALDLELENERIFELEVKPQDQKYSIEFRDLKPSEPAKTSEVTLEVKTNTAKPYQVTQNITLDLTNKEGKAIPSRYFTLQTVPLDTKGKLNFTDKQEVKKGTSVLFISDSQGSPDKFKVVYELACPKETTAGDYGTDVTYSLTEI
jgi:hypothetical protein